MSGKGSMMHMGEERCRIKLPKKIKNVMLVPFYIVFCHHRKVSEYTVDCRFFIYGCIKPVSVPMLTPQPLPKPRRSGTWASELDSWTTDSDESQFLLHHMDGWVLCILYLVNSWQQNALWKECKPTESPCLHISVSKGGSIKKKGGRWS